jgi:iron complex transport system substrate-binding protein
VRIVSLTCSNTEIVWALGQAHALVGVDDHSDFPTEVVSGLPRVGPDLDIDVEKVAALAPDLVLASLTVPGHEHVVSRLSRAKLPFIATEPVSLDDVYADVRLVAERIGVPERAELVVAEMQKDLAPEALEAGERPSILVEWWPKPVIIPGRLSWVTQMIAAAGGKGPLDEEDVKSRPITDDEARVMDPDAIVIAWCGVPFEKYRPEIVQRREAWQSLRAVRENRIYRVPEAYLGRPGPRLGLGLRELRRIVTQIQSRGRPSTSSS